MTIFEVFGSAEEAASSFLAGVAFGTVLVLASASAILAWADRRWGKQYWESAAALSITVIIVVVWTSYGMNFGRFIAAQVAPDGAHLHFAGPSGRDLFIASDSVETVLFGLPGKSNRQCYIRILLKSGESYRSVTFDREAGACKQLMREINQVLSPPAQAVMKGTT